jgi:peptide/nickel transport system ATP-binding protein
MMQETKQTPPIMKVENLTKHFNTGNALSKSIVRAVQDANFELQSSQVVALVGESGSGKSTIVRMLARLYKPTSGNILFQGDDVSKIRGRKETLAYVSKVQMIFQDPFASLNPAHPIGYQLTRPLILHGKVGRNKKAQRQKVLDLLERVALTPPEQYIDKYPHQLSGGQRQRIAIARALAVEPLVILADEPVSMLDVSIRLGVLNLMERLRSDDEIAFLYVTHDLASARYFADKILVMYAGHIVEQSPSEELIQDPQHPYTQLLLSAVPNPEKGLRTANVEAKGEIPDLATLGAGCPFAERCPQVMAKCWDAMPPVTQLEDNRWVRCYLHENERATAVPALASA